MSAYELFSILSGIALVGLAVGSRGETASTRFWSFAGGVGFIAYGIYVSQQTEGTYYFPAHIFVIPVVAVIGLTVKAFSSGKQGPSSNADTSAGA